MLRPSPALKSAGFSLYLHTPFCRNKCPYCDFFSIVPTDHTEISGYPELLLQELIAAQKEWSGPIHSIFFGGGTPSLLPTSGIRDIIDCARSTFEVSADAEISLEANPGTLTPSYLTELRQAGVNRLSLGIQALADDDLQRLGRIHTYKDSCNAIFAAKDAGFDNISLDLIYGRPDQDALKLQAEIHELISLQPQHLSCYGLTIEEGTPYAQLQREGKLVLSDEETAEHYEIIDRILTAEGYRHYEISNFALPGYECAHNLRYWQRQNYLGLGPGAHSFTSRGWGERLEVPANLPLYKHRLAEGKSTIESIEVCTRQLAMAEMIYLGMRTKQGVSDQLFKENFGTDIDKIFPLAVKRCRDYLVHENGYWRFTLQGWLLYDHLIANFL